MISLNKLETLKPGDVLEIGAMFPGVCKEPVLYELIEVKPSKMWLFVMTWFGVNIGLCRLTRSTKGGLIKVTEARG
jgi:hypothetical protein